MKDVVKLTLNMHSSNLEAAREIAKEQNRTVTDVINHAMKMEKYFMDRIDEKATILIKEANGTIREVIFK